MQHKQSLSLKEAILININIMLGSGIFINTVLLAKNAAVASGFLYILNGILVLPLILSMASLMRLHPRGGFYTFGAQEVSDFAGFLSAWSYFVGKLASATLMIHTAFLLIQSIIPLFQSINILALDLAAVLCFTALNLLRMNVSMGVQSMTFIIKLIPIMFVVLVGLFLLSPGDWTAPATALTIIKSMPLVLFTSLGFEATLSLSEKIENPQVNGPRAILYAFSAVIGLSFLFQTLFYGALGNTLAQFPNFLFAFPALATKISNNPSFIFYLSSLFHLAIATSALGGAYSVLFSTHWNLYAIAQHGYAFCSQKLLTLNAHAMPAVGIVLQGCVCLFYFLITRGNQIPLQLIATFGCTIAYTISVLALLNAHLHKKIAVSPWIPRLALFNCALFIASSFYSLISATFSAFLLFFGMIFCGIAMFWMQKDRSDSEL